MDKRSASTTENYGPFTADRAAARARMLLEMIDFVLKEFKAVKGVLPQILINTMQRSILRKYRIRTVD